MDGGQGRGRSIHDAYNRLDAGEATEVEVTQGNTRGVT